jgi:ectoine hydroxylase-related dioxygenase (phytanoyl-CoA dioxygenase family)
MANHKIARIANSGDLLEIAQRYLGDEAVPYKATLFNKSGRANWLVAWHQDTAVPLTEKFDRAGWGPWSTKAGIRFAHAPPSILSRIIALRIHLDPSTTENGPLRVIPGSHKLGVLRDDEILKHARDKAPAECTAPKGAVVAMRPLLIHASSKSDNDAPRRILHIEYAASLDIDDDVKLAIA